MNYVWKFKVVIILLCIFLVCCNNEENIPDGESPDIGIPMEEMNSSLTIEAPQGLGNSFKNGEGLYLIANNRSQETIKFSVNYGIMLFVYKEGIWHEVENKMSYPEGPRWDVILPPSNDNPLRKGNFGAVPYIVDLKSKIPLRVVIIGEKVLNGKGTNEKVAAYIDLFLYPSDVEWR